MNVRKKQKLMTIISVVLFVLAIGLFVWYEFGGGRSTLNYKDVWVLKEPLKQGHSIVKESMLVKEKINKELFHDEYVKDPKEIVGLEAKHYIPAKIPLVKSYFDDANVVLNEGEYIAQIPKSWITSVPNSLRRGDNVILYATQIMTDEVKSKTFTTNEEGEIVVEEAENVEPVINQELIELSQTTVAYVKDSANNEVVTVSNEDRKDANSSISSVEIVTTPEEFKKIEEQVNNGSFLIIMYTDNKNGNETKMHEEIEKEGE